jgi:hypothetical protein
MKSISPNVAYDWLGDRRVLAYQIRDVNISEMVLLGQHSLTNLKNWQPPHLARLFIYDLSHPGVALAYLALNGRNLFNLGGATGMQIEIERFKKRFPDIRVYLAIVVASTLSGNTALKYSKSQNPSLTEGSTFFDQNSAYRWLIEKALNLPD